jgi:chorismate mutase/prephenate dehydratase
MKSVLYLGPPGTFTHIVAKLAFADADALADETTIAGVFERVACGDAELGVVPIENSSEGSVALTLDCLLTSSLRIQRELVLDVEHCLVASHGELERVVRVASHPQALAQCRRWLAEHLPGRELSPVASTSAAAREAARDPALAAVASRLAAELAGLEVVSEGIQDHSPNVTRFVVVGAGDVAPTGRDRTSIVFSLPHQKGALRGALGIFESAGLNLTRIESRPLPGRLWEYLFFVDLEGHAGQPALAAALDELSRSSGMLRVLGSYPRAF